MFLTSTLLMATVLAASAQAAPPKTSDLGPTVSQSNKGEPYELHLLIYDRSFTPQGRLYYPIRRTKAFGHLIDGLSPSELRDNFIRPHHVIRLMFQDVTVPHIATRDILGTGQ